MGKGKKRTEESGEETVLVRGCGGLNLIKWVGTRGREGARSGVEVIREEEDPTNREGDRVSRGWMIVDDGSVGHVTSG